MTSKLETILVLTLMIGIISGLGFASILLRAESAERPDKGSNDEQSSDSNDDGGKEESNDSGGDDGSSSQSKDEGGTSEEDKQEDRGVLGKEKEDNKPINHDELKGTPEEQEKAAVEDFVNEEPGEKQPYPYVKHGPVTDGNGPSKIFKGPFECKPDKTDKDNSVCTEKHPKGREGPCHGMWAHECKDDDWKDKDHWDGKCDHWWSNWNCHHGKHHHNNNHHDNHNHRDSTHTHTSGGHGDLELIIHIDHYNTKSSNKLHDFNLQIDVIQEDDSDNVYDKNLDLSKMPDEIKIDNLDIDKGDLFLTQLVNNDAEDGDSYLAVADEDPVHIYITAE